MFLFCSHLRQLPLTSRNVKFAIGGARVQRDTVFWRGIHSHLWIYQRAGNKNTVHH